MRRFLSAALVLGAMAVGGAYAADSGTAQPAATTDQNSSQTSDLNEIICKQMGPPTGSRLGNKKVCQTRKRWLELERQTQDQLDKAQRGCGGGGCGGQ
ncbi:MAG: hypothetical protein KGJ78_14630 [Alphaproteobacteria bacterium]|nr:hypothetical protein [Alphaproteobacteria bacterium]